MFLPTEGEEMPVQQTSRGWEGLVADAERDTSPTTQPQGKEESACYSTLTKVVIVFPGERGSSFSMSVEEASRFGESLQTALAVAHKDSRVVPPVPFRPYPPEEETPWASTEDGLSGKHPLGYD